MKRLLPLAGILLALLLVGVGWSTNLTLSGRDIVTEDGGGADVLAAGKGEDLLCGGMADHYPWPNSAVTISAQVTSASDAGWVVAEGLSSGGDEQADSVLAAGIGIYAIPGTWWRVNLARFRDDSTNTSTINILAGSNVLATILPRHSRSCPDHYTLPAGKRQLLPRSLRVTPVAVFSGAPSPGDSSAVGSVAVLGREYGGNWYMLDELLFDTDAGAVAFVYPATEWNVGGRADVVVAAGLTEARTEIGYRLEAETK